MNQWKYDDFATCLFMVFYFIYAVIKFHASLFGPTDTFAFRFEVMRNSHICKYHRCKTIPLCKHFTVFSIYWIAGFCTPDLSNCYRLKTIFEFNYKFKSGINSKLAIHFQMLGIWFKSIFNTIDWVFFSQWTCVFLIPYID